MEYLYNEKFGLVFSLLIITPALYLAGTNQLPEEYKPWLVYIAIVFGVVCLMKLARVMSWTKKVKILSMLEGMEGNTECTNVHHVKIFDSNPGLSHPILKVNVGECVIWTNIGKLQHTVTSTADYRHPDNVFASGHMKPRGWFGVKFLVPGEYKYFCMSHKGGMESGLVVVK